MGITSEDVALAAERIQEEGENPTIERIRILLGAGSNTTISKYLKIWRDNYPVTKPSVKSPPDQVQAAVSAVWEKLQQETQTTIEVIKAEANDQVAAAQQEAELAKAAMLALKEEHEMLKVQHHALSAQKELLALDYKQLETDRKMLQERLEALEARHQEIKFLHEQQLKLLEGKHLAELDRLKLHAEQEVKLAQQLADTLKSHYEDARADSMNRLDKLNIENQKNQDSIKRLEADNAGLKQSLEDKTAMHQHLSAQLEQAQKLIQDQQAQARALQDKRFVTEDIIAAFEAMPLQVASNLQALLAEQVKVVIDQAVEAISIKPKEVAHA